MLRMEESRYCGSRPTLTKATLLSTDEHSWWRLTFLFWENLKRWHVKTVLRIPPPLSQGLTVRRTENSLEARKQVSVRIQHQQLWFFRAFYKVQGSRKPLHMKIAVFVAWWRRIPLVGLNHKQEYLSSSWSFSIAAKKLLFNTDSI